MPFYGCRPDASTRVLASQTTRFVKDMTDDTHLERCDGRRRRHRQIFCHGLAPKGVRRNFAVGDELVGDLIDIITSSHNSYLPEPSSFR
jgi:hypothetical protein